MLCAYVFGTSEAMSAFTIGFQVPEPVSPPLRRGALSASSIPVLTDKLHRGGVKAVDELSGKLMGVLLPC